MQNIASLMGILKVIYSHFSLSILNVLQVHELKPTAPYNCMIYKQVFLGKTYTIQKLSSKSNHNRQLLEGLSTYLSTGFVDKP